MTKVLFAIIMVWSGISAKDISKFIHLPDNHPFSGFDSLNVGFVGNWPFGYSFAVVYDEDRNLVFFGSGGGVYTLDISDPAHPVKISEVIHTRGIVDGLFYDSSSQTLYIAAGEGGFEIWDVSEPQNSMKLGSYYTPGRPRDVYVSGVYAYVADGWVGLQIYQNLLSVQEQRRTIPKDFVRVIPLSTHGYITFLASSPLQVKLSLFNIAGQRVYKFNGFFKRGENRIKISMPSGLYFYKIESEEGDSAGKVIVVKKQK